MITSTANDRVKWVRALQAKRRAREADGVFVAEGTRWAQEFLDAQVPPRLVFHTDHLDNADRGLINRLSSLGADVVPVADDIMKALSDTESPQDILVVAPIPDIPVPGERSLVLVADRLRDPGNLGTLLRSALAADVDQVVLTKGTVDPYNPKVIRGGMGAQLHLPITPCEPAALSTELAGLTVRVAETGQGTAYTQVDWRPPCALIVGGEAHGSREGVRALAAEFVHIPISGPSDSLNAAVAAAVVLFEIRRQRGSP